MKITQDMMIWEDISYDGYDWEARAVFFDGDNFRLVDDAGCSCFEPWEELDLLTVDDCLILSPFWEGWQERSKEIGDLLTVLRNHQHRPNWLNQIG